MKKIVRITGLLIAVVAVNVTFGQQKSISSDSLSVSVNKLSKTVQALDRIKVSGYIQAQFQVADTLGVKTYEGGDFASSSSKRFMVRRGYFKIAYAGNLSTYVLQFNVNEKGFSIRDAYFSLKEPWFKAFSLTGGIFYRPFGCELPYPTYMRETPELARVTQTLFPGERDLGASITFQMPEKSVWHPFKLEAGLFTGNGTASETDDKLDFIGRLGYSNVSSNDKISYGLGLSYYNGTVTDTNRFAYEMIDYDGTWVFKKIANSGSGNYHYKREYFGLDGQFAINTLIGKTTVRADYMFGSQPGFKKKSMSPSDTISLPVYMRDFKGGVVYLIQTLPGSIHSFICKFDYYDPNTKVRGDKIGLKPSGSGDASSNTDLAYSTWGFGYLADVNKNLRFTVYYDLVKNEISSAPKIYSTDLKDNVLTIRVQYRF